MRDIFAGEGQIIGESVALNAPPLPFETGEKYEKGSEN